MNYIYVRTKYFNYHIADHINSLLTLYENSSYELFDVFDDHFPRVISQIETEV